MSKKLTFSETCTLIERAMPILPEFATHAFDSMGGHDVQPDTLGRSAKSMLDFYAPILDQTDWTGQPGHNAAIAKRYETTKRLLACHAMSNQLRRGVKTMKQEATTAGLDLPTFTRQLLMTVSRAFAKLFAPELFAIVPLTGPTGRINFKVDQYDSTLSSGSPTVASGQYMDDPTKFNPNYYAAPEGQVARSITFKYSNLDVSVSDYRVFAQWTDTLADDAMAVYDDDAEQHLINRMSTEMARVWDRSLIGAVVSGFNTANVADFVQFPTANPNYATLGPSETEYYDKRLYRIAMTTLFVNMATTRRFNNDGQPTWAIVGPTFQQALMSLEGFVPFENAIDEMSGATGALRDIGAVKGLGIRFLTDPMLAATVQTVSGGSDTNGAKYAYFGRTPVERDDVGIKLCPFIALQQTRDRYDPENGTTTKGVRSRFAIAQPNTGSNADSSILGDIYGRLRLQ